GLQVGEPLVADAANVAQLVDGTEPTAPLALLDDRLRERRPDAGELLELRLRRGVEIHWTAGVAGGTGAVGRRPIARRRRITDLLHEDTLAVGHLGREVEPIEVGSVRTA